MSQTGTASGGSTVIQAGRDITVHGPVMAVRHVPVAQPMESVPLPPGVRRLPVTSGVFVGRDTELAQLDAAVAGSGDGTAVVAVHGPGGVGKSALVARFAERHEGLVWWITADSAAALDAGLAELALALTSQAADWTAEQRVEASVRWLASHHEWLVVLDDVTDPDDALRLVSRVRTGTVVITSRADAGWRGLELTALPREQVVDLLCLLVRREWPEADLTGAEDLCAALGGQPSAIDQAAAYLARHRLAPPGYLARLARFPGWTPTASSDSVPILVRDFEASPDHEVRCRIVWELARVGTTAAREALRSLRPRHDIERLSIREALEI
ncbi:ATP-binding protein [Saccharothrix sp. NRRL B-16348]|uniref:ATP-binding protein n=1 Tax=Saccharothrix sp. NRRL B-16348 TaxID=1415542 RepID=UPI0006AD8C7C|nr:ATP-binding protein [Saccharothrix sp. NRRL B-16348]